MFYLPGMADIIAFKPVSGVKGDLVEQLQGLLKAAEAGDLDGLAFVGHWADGETSIHTCGVRSLSMIGELHILQNMLAEDRMPGK